MSLSDTHSDFRRVILLYQLVIVCTSHRSSGEITMWFFYCTHTDMTFCHLTRLHCCMPPWRAK